MSDPDQKDRSTTGLDRGVNDRGLWVPSLRPPFGEPSQKPDQHDRCRLEVAESLMIRRLRSIWTEDVMRLYVDSFLPNEGGGRPFPTTYGGETAGWERTFPRCWLRQNRPTLEDELQKRFRKAGRAREFERLHWYLQFIDHPSLHASEQARQSLRRLIEGAVGQNILQQAQRDWGREAIDRLRQGLRTFAEGPLEKLEISEQNQFLRYISALWAYARVVLNLLEGGTGHLPQYSVEDARARSLRPDVQGAERARAAWFGLEDSHRMAVRRQGGELRSSLSNEMRRQIARVAHAVGYPVTPAQINTLAQRW